MRILGWSGAVSAAAMVLCFAACTGNTSVSPAQDAPPALTQLPSPGDVTRSTAAVAPFQRLGAHFLPAFTQRVTADGTMGRFAPEFTDGSGIGDLAYATYKFDAATLSGSATCRVTWLDPPGPGDAFLGLAAWEDRRWEWHSLESADTAIALSTVSGYVHPDDGRLLALVVTIGTEECALGSVRIEPETAVPYWRATQVTPVPARRSYLRLVELQGRPAMTYWEDGLSETPQTSRIMLARALDPAGEAWAPPQVIWDVPIDELSTGVITSLYPLIVQDKLSILLELRRDEEFHGLHVLYLRSLDAAATSFSEPVIAFDMDYPPPGNVTVLYDAKVAGGRAVGIVYDWIWEGRWFLHADDEEGSTWSQQIIDAEAGPTYEYGSGLLFAGGLPASLHPTFDWDPEGIASLNRMHFRRATTPSGGGAWDAPVDVLPPISRHPPYSAFARALPMTLADGRPAFLYGSGSTRSFFVALDSLGDTWPAVGTPVAGLEDAADVTQETVGGVPALAYLKYAPGGLYYRAAADEYGVDWPDAQQVLSGPVHLRPSLAEIDGAAGVACLVQTPDAGQSYPVYVAFR